MRRRYAVVKFGVWKTSLNGNPPGRYKIKEGKKRVWEDEEQDDLEDGEAQCR